MRTQIVFGLIAVAVALGMSHGVCAGQPECTNVYFRIYDPESDPPCDDGFDVDVDWSIYVDSSPTPVSSIGTCSTFSLTLLYTDVVFYDDSGDCGENAAFTCDIVASANLSGYYYIKEENGACLRVCENCSP